MGWSCLHKNNKSSRKESNANTFIRLIKRILMVYEKEQFNYDNYHEKFKENSDI